jgi:homoserine O-acetyltransferase/O-succinyltransferase
MTAHAETPPACAEPVLGDVDLSLLSSLDGRFARVRIRHARYGAANAPCVVVQGGISASRLAGEWWAAQVGPGCAIDTDRFQVLGIDFIDTLPEGWRGITPHDQAAALAGVLDALGVECIEAIVGASYGGAVALAFAERFPQRLRAALVLSMADRPAPMASALRAVQRDLLRLGEELGCEQRTVALARALAVTTYRSEAEFALRFEGAAREVNGTWRLPVEDYLSAQGQRFAARFDARRYRLLSESLDLHRVNPRRLRVPLYLLAVNEDRLVPRADMEKLARATDASITCLSSTFGHDAFLKEPSAVGAWITSALTDLSGSRAKPATPHGVPVATPVACTSAESAHPSALPRRGPSGFAAALKAHAERRMRKPRLTLVT